MHPSRHLNQCFPNRTARCLPHRPAAGNSAERIHWKSGTEMHCPKTSVKPYPNLQPKKQCLPAGPASEAALHHQKLRRIHPRFQKNFPLPNFPYQKMQRLNRPLRQQFLRFLLSPHLLEFPPPGSDRGFLPAFQNRGPSSSSQAALLRPAPYKLPGY